MSIDRDKALERIRKLLNHAKSSGERISEAEVDTYMSHARKLMNEFNVLDAEVEQADPVGYQQAAYNSIRTERTYSRAGKLDRFMIDLAWAPAIICDVKFYLENVADPKKNQDFIRKCYRGRIRFQETGYRQTITYYGLPRDVAVAAELYKELLTAMRVMCKVRYGEARPTEYKDYCLGFAARLRSRAYYMKQENPLPSTCTAIVLIKEDILKRYADEKLQLTSRKKRGGSPKSEDAFDAGHEDGEKVSLETNQMPEGKSQSRLE